jgi:hypothetical protein
MGVVDFEVCVDKNAKYHVDQEIFLRFRKAFLQVRGEDFA